MNPDINIKRAETHEKPSSWMRYQKSKLYNMRKFKDNRGVDIVWQWHSHPSGNKKLHKMDEKILEYMSSGVMVIVIPPVPDKNQEANIVGWYYNERNRKNAEIKKMVFEIISK